MISNSNQVKHSEQQILQCLDSLSDKLEGHRRQQRSLLEDATGQTNAFLAAQSKVDHRTYSALSEANLAFL